MKLIRQWILGLLNQFKTVQNISKAEAKKHLKALKMYLMKSSNDNGEELKILAAIEQALAAIEM